MGREPCLGEICREAMAAGRQIDLSDCPYGETTGPCRFINRPSNYYYLLAGLVKTQKLTHILETGTNYGGSVMAMTKGLSQEDIPKSRIVTVDIEERNHGGFARYPYIKRITGDALHIDVIKKVLACFDRDIGMLYIDSVHEYEHTKANIDIYAGKLNPKYIVLDDIRQSEGMKRLWSELETGYGDNAFDASDVSVRKGAGFGVVRFRPV